MEKKEKIINGFDPNGVGVKGSLFGLPFDVDTSDTVIIPVPWDVTVSYGAGTKNGPKAVLDASPQIDFALPEVKDAWKAGITMLKEEQWISETSDRLRMRTAAYIEALEEGLPYESDVLLDEVEDESENLAQWLKGTALELMSKGKTVGLLGGDHSTPLGLYKAVAESVGYFGILQIDAHADLRKAYEGFEYSHASIMRNALSVSELKKLVQVGIRDFCEEERDVVLKSEDRVVSFYDQTLKEEAYAGTSWAKQCEKIIDNLPEKVHVSFDIDGLDPKLCPNTGTPVPGGFEFDQVMFLIKKLALSGRKIVSFDLCEVCPGNDEWDGNVGARVLYRLAVWSAISRGVLSCD
ncbi:agmatinase [Fulvitalea axinellae]|uniref:Agmatinase n=1 Tax=Fulvitalea axinellae TaxID=1182444 RepID=A0AAU9D3C4_9BACT|nr:agmatinase [Fulvitalea axinellae]